MSSEDTVPSQVTEPDMNGEVEALTKDLEKLESVKEPAPATIDYEEIKDGTGANGNEANGDNAQKEQEEDSLFTETPSSPVFKKVSKASLSPSSSTTVSEKKQPSEVKQIPVGEPSFRSRIKFDVVNARVVETGGKRHVTYSILMKRATTVDPRPASIERRYNDFCYIYECILRSFHPSILGDYLFPKKVLIGNFKAEVITERTDSFQKFLNLIATCDNLLYSDYFYSFLSSEEHNEAISHIKLAKYDEAVPLLENIFYVREKLLTISNINVLQCLCELIACQHAVNRLDEAYSYVLVASRSFEILKGHPDAELMKIAFLKIGSHLASVLGHNSRPFDKELSQLRYNGVRIDNAKSLLEIIRERYIHRASHTSKLS